MSDAGRQRTAVHGTKKQLADALHTVTVERDALRQQFDGNKEPCVICSELCSSYAGNPNKWPVRLGNDGWRHIGCVNKQLAERDALRQALGDIIKLCPKVLHGERDVVDIAEIAHSVLKGGGNQGAEVAAAKIGRGNTK